MSATDDEDKAKPNSLLSVAFALFAKVAPRGQFEPERAWRELVPQLRYLLVDRIEQPTIAQLEVIRSLNNDKSLVQIRKAIQANELRFGPFPGDLAERTLIPQLMKHGLSVSLRELSEQEKAEQLKSIDDLPPYFQNRD